MAFAGAVLANIVPVLLSFDEIDLLRDNMQRIEDTNRVSRDAVPSPTSYRACEGLQRCRPHARYARARLFLAQTAGDVDRLSQSLDRLLANAREWMSPEQFISLTAATARISGHWRALRTLPAPGQPSLAIYRDLVSDTDTALAVLRDLESKTSRKSATITALVFEHLTVTGALLAGAIAIGFSITLSVR